MKQLLNIFILILISSCGSQTDQDDFSYDPTIPYPKLNSGDFWLDKFDERGLQNARVYNDNVFCHTVNPREDTYLYCFDLISGRVKWRAQVDEYAIQPIVKINDKIIYCSYLGEMTAFDTLGIELWKTKYDKSYAGHWLDPSDLKIKMKGVIGAEIKIYNLNGEVDGTIISPSLKKKITKNGNKVDIINNQYKVNHNGWKYDIDVSISENDEKHNIKIKKHL
jgi:outer membrane protein assembly factor BamB